VLKGVPRLAARGGVVLVACEDRFRLDRVVISAARHIELVHQSCFCFPASVHLPNFDYGFHFFAAGGSA
jgi:hypothetical protein